MRPILFMTFSHILHKPAHYIVTFFHIHHRWIKPFVMFYKIHHGWRTNSPVSMYPPIVFCLHGMNISCWSHKSDLYQKNFFKLLKYNIMSSWLPTWHIDVRLAHMSAQHGMDFFRWNSKWCENEVWIDDYMVIKSLNTRLLLQSYYFFVLCSRILIWSSQHANESQTCHLSGPVNMVVGSTCQVQSAW
jgi:hypothetical protein